MAGTTDNRPPDDERLLVRRAIREDSEAFGVLYNENSEPGSLVFQTDWDDFTRLFFYNTTNVYTIGLDVTYMARFPLTLVRVSSSQI